MLKKTLIIFMFGIAFLSDAKAQNAPVSINNIDARAFSVHVFAAPGSNREQAGSMAMEAACGESLRRGFTRMGVNDFRMSNESGRQQTSQGSTQYHGGTDGRAVGAVTTQGESRNVTYGRALLQVQLMDEATAQGIRWMQIVDAQSCTIIE